jgi:hypothetical protein
MMSADDPGAAMTTKDIVLDVWRDMKRLVPAVEILVSQDLDSRLRSVESCVAQRAGGDRRAQTVDGTIRGWAATVTSVSAVVIAVAVALTR